MCGRYYIEISDKELQEICDALSDKRPDEHEQLKIKLGGEIFPADVVPVCTGIKEYRFMKWGFSGFDKRPVINARSETAFIKPMFRDSMKDRRCLIPASGYYEWLKENNVKTKYRFSMRDKPLYFAGCFRQEKDSPVQSFVILTREASGGAEKIHGRMPLIIQKSGAALWLSKGAFMDNLPAGELFFEPTG